MSRLRPRLKVSESQCRDPDRDWIYKSLNVETETETEFTRSNPSKVQSLIVIKENKKQVEQYLHNCGIEKLPETDNKGEKAFEKVKVQKKFVVADIDSDDEVSSGNEYFMDEDWICTHFSILFE